MAIGSRLRRLLDDNEISYEIVSHPKAFTATETAQVTHISGRDLTKVVALRDSAGFVFLIALPAIDYVDLVEVGRLTGGRTVELVPEHDLTRLFPDCELGAIPPFGHLYGMRTFLDPCLIEPFITFAAGSHREVVHMRLEDLESLEHPFETETCLHLPHPARPRSCVVEVV